MVLEMEMCQYEQVNSDSAIPEVKVKEEFPWKSFLRQVMVSTGAWNGFFIMGLLLGAPTVYIPQLRKEANSTEAVTEEMATWLSSIHGLAALPWMIVLPLVTNWIGRKYPFLVVSIVTFVTYIFFYCSTTVTHIFISQMFLGISTGTQFTVSIIIITEYTSPKYRGLSLTLQSASFNWGMLAANALGTFYHWKTITVLGIICTLYNSMLTWFWCESPYWLASKQRFEACVKAHRWIKGEDAESEKELNVLIKTYKEHFQRRTRKIRKDTDNYITKSTNYIVKSYEIAIQKAFYKSFIICIVLLSLQQCTGKLVVSIYAIDILKKITLSESMAYKGMLLLDCVSVAGMYVGCGLSKVYNRRTLLFVGSAFGALFLYCLSLYLYLVHSSFIQESKYISLALLIMFSIAVSVGPVIMATSIYGELVPSRFKTFNMITFGVYIGLLSFFALKTGPLIFSCLKLHGAFLFYGLVTTIITVFLFKYLPETKDKTMQEIEHFFIGVTKQSDDARATLMNDFSDKDTGTETFLTRKQ